MTTRLFDQRLQSRGFRSRKSCISSMIRKGMTVFDYAMPNFEYSWGDKSNSASDSDYREGKNSEKYFILAGLFKVSDTLRMNALFLN
jgi:hypothetical protein